VGVDRRKRLPRLETREDDARGAGGVKRQHLRAERNQVTNRQHDQRLVFPGDANLGDLVLDCAN
jgi:hypothetical protein